MDHVSTSSLLTTMLRLEAWDGPSRDWRIETVDSGVECRVIDAPSRATGYGRGADLAHAVGAALDDFERGEVSR